MQTNFILIFNNKFPYLFRLIWLNYKTSSKIIQTLILKLWPNGNHLDRNWNCDERIKFFLNHILHNFLFKLSFSIQGTINPINKLQEKRYIKLLKNFSLFMNNYSNVKDSNFNYTSWIPNYHLLNVGKRRRC